MHSSKQEYSIYSANYSLIVCKFNVRLLPQKYKKVSS